MLSIIIVSVLVLLILAGLVLLMLIPDKTERDEYRICTTMKNGTRVFYPCRVKIKDGVIDNTYSVFPLGIVSTPGDVLYEYDI